MRLADVLGPDALRRLERLPDVTVLVADIVDSTDIAKLALAGDVVGLLRDVKGKDAMPTHYLDAKQPSPSIAPRPSRESEPQPPGGSSPRKGHAGMALHLARGGPR